MFIDNRKTISSNLKEIEFNWKRKINFYYSIRLGLCANLWKGIIS